MSDPFPPAILAFVMGRLDIKTIRTSLDHHHHHRWTIYYLIKEPSQILF